MQIHKTFAKNKLAFNSKSKSLQSIGAGAYNIPTGTARFQSHWNKCKRTHIGVFNGRPIKEIFGA